METRTNVVDFASYRFARDLRMTDARDVAAQPAPLAKTPPREFISEEAAAHRERMLRHLAQLPRR